MQQETRVLSCVGALEAHPASIGLGKFKQVPVFMRKNKQAIFAEAH